MSQQFNVAVLGASGAVGQAMIEILEERAFPVATLYPLASSRSAGDTVRFGGKNIEIKDVEEFDWSQVQIALFSAGAEVSAKWAPIAAEQGCIVIDNTSCFRYDEDIPLVIPEVNPEALADFRNRNIIANPNCSTIQMLVALKPLQDEQEEAGRNHEPGGPDDQPTGAVRHLAGLPGIHEHRPGKHHDRDGHRHQEKYDAKDVDPDLPAPRKLAREQVNPHVFVAHQRIAAAGEKDQAEQVPLDFKEGVRTVIGAVTHHGVGGADQDDKEHEPAAGLADVFGERVDAARQREQVVHESIPRMLAQNGFEKPKRSAFDG